MECHELLNAQDVLSQSYTTLMDCAGKSTFLKHFNTPCFVLDTLTTKIELLIKNRRNAESSFVKIVENPRNAKPLNYASKFHQLTFKRYGII